MIKSFWIIATMFAISTRVSAFHPVTRNRGFGNRVLSLRSADPSMEDSVKELLGSAMNRASSTLVGRDIAGSKDDGLAENSTMNSLMESASKRAKVTLDSKKRGNRGNRDSESTSKHSRSTNGRIRSKPYNENPAITNTALAQTLWSSILRPNIDTAIDATCGNGYDSVELAQMLFDGPEEDCNSQLICIDIQQQACVNTTAALAKVLPLEIAEKHVQVLHTSHAPLPRPNDSSSVGLVVYNLGYLPRSDKDCLTKMDSTLESIVDAFLMVRVGGMVSVVTYPKSNREEDIAVRALLECAALLSSKVQTWREFLERSIDSDDENIRTLVTSMMERVEMEGDPGQTWRVSEHKKLGMDRAPILLTATRIK